MSKINILLIDNALTSDEDLKDILSESEFNVHTIKGPFTNDQSIDDFKPDLILFRDPENRLNIKNKSEIISNIKKLYDVPALIFSPVEVPSSYLEELEANLFYHITTPCSLDYLVARIKNVISGSNLKGTDDKDHKIDVNYEGKNYKLNMSEGRLISFIISIMENSAHQNIILNNIVHKNCKIKKMDSSGEIIDRQSFCSDDDSGYGYRIHRAFEKKEFRLFYQPVISLDDNRVVGFETLIRWMDPERGIVAPLDFMPVIESSQLIVPLGYWIAAEAASQLKKWQDKFRFPIPPRININLSPRQFAQKELCSRMTEIINRNGVSANDFGFEITESVLLDDVEAANLTLLQFKSNDFSLYMDDFGTGYSSLSYLLYFPIDIIKIDKSFVQWMHIDELSEEIVKSVITLAHNLKKKVVAEGVETEEHFESLKNMGCDYGQGYYFSVPMPSEEAEAYLENFYAGKIKH